MPCKGCTSSLCNCFTASTETVITVGNGSQYSPFTFRPSATPFPRPFGHLQGETNQNLDGAPYSLFPATTVQDIDAGGNLIVGNGSQLRASVDGLYLIGFTARIAPPTLDNIIDNISLRKNSTILVSGASLAQTASIAAGTNEFLSSVTLVDLNQNDTIDMFVERTAGAGNVAISYGLVSSTHFYIQLWGLWLGGPI